MTLRKKSKIKIAYEDSQKIKTEEKIIDWSKIVDQKQKQFNWYVNFQTYLYWIYIL